MIKQKLKTKFSPRMFLGVGVVFVMAVFIGFVFMATSKEIDAADMSGFKAGNIISDEVMGDYNSMSEAEIQAFLTSKNDCGNRDYGYYVSLSQNAKYSWHWDNGHFVCLSEERFGDGEIIGSGDTAAHIIWQAAQDYKINPKVLIVLLQKETGLITDKIPNNGDYRKAAGFGCPDNAPCSAEYYGFKNQVRRAAEMYRTVLDGGWTNHPVGWNYIQYNPNGGCGGSNVYIENRATSALYRYTPYQPNASALASDYGGGDACGAYGNRNFYSYFSDWFGSLQVAIGLAETRLPDGVYSIHSSLDHSKVLDIKDGNNNNGANIQIWSNSRNNVQRWQLTQRDGGYYSITNPDNGKALDVYGAGTANGTNIQLYEYNGTCAQLWKIRRNNGYYVIQSACSSSSVIDLAGGNVGNGNNVYLWSNNLTGAQAWDFVPFEKVTEGVYEIVSAVNNNSAIDISGGNSSNGTNIQIWDGNYTGAQKWRIQNIGNDKYRVVNPANNKVLDISGAGVNNGTNVQLYEYNGTCAQLWRIIRNGDNYTFISTCSGASLDLSGGSSNNGTNIQIWQSSNNDAQKWKLNNLKAVADGFYEIASGVGSSKVIDISGGAEGAKSGTNMQIWDRNGTNAQKWKIAYQKDIGYYTIRNMLNGGSLDVYGAGISAGTNVQFWEYNNTCAQYWQIIENDTGYNIISACSGLTLDVYGGENRNGANIQIWDRNGTNAQKWSLKKI